MEPPHPKAGDVKGHCLSPVYTKGCPTLFPDPTLIPHPSPAPVPPLMPSLDAHPSSSTAAAPHLPQVLPHHMMFQGMAAWPGTPALRDQAAEAGADRSHLMDLNCPRWLESLIHFPRGGGGSKWFLGCGLPLSHSGDIPLSRAIPKHQQPLTFQARGAGPQQPRARSDNGSDQLVPDHHHNWCPPSLGERGLEGGKGASGTPETTQHSVMWQGTAALDTNT